MIGVKWNFATAREMRREALRREARALALLALAVLLGVALAALLTGCGSEPDEVTEITNIYCPVADCLITERSAPCMRDKLAACQANGGALEECITKGTRACPVTATEGSPCVLDCMVSMSSLPCLIRTNDKCSASGGTAEECLLDGLQKCPVE